MFAHMEAAIAQNHGEVAAVIVEPLVQCAGGMRMYDPVYLKLLREACDQYQVHLIADEIAVGFGRTGTMFACEQAGIRPDYLCLSKGLTGGYLPLSAVLTTDAIYDAFYDEYSKLNAFLHSHSYTGNPLACAAANATLAIFRDEPVLERNRATAARMLASVEHLRDHPHVAEIRQCGMILAIELMKDPRDAHALAVGRAARPAHLPACARARRVDTAARHHDLFHAALRHRTRGDRPAGARRHRRHRARMRLTRSMCPAPLAAGAEIVLPAQAGEHLTRVLRLQPGAPFTLFDGDGRRICGDARAADGKKVIARVLRHDAMERESPLESRCCRAWRAASAWTSSCRRPPSSE